MELSPQQVLGLRMSSLLLRASPGDAGRATSVVEVVTWLGAMQAQDLASGLWSFGVRLPGLTAADVTDALERREALRTWPMRGTIHFVPSRDARWMLELMGVRALNGAARRREQLGLSEETAVQAMEVLGAALTGGGRLTRSECLAALADKGIDTSGQRGYHLLWYASQRGLLCIAPNIGNEQSFVLLDEWVPDPHRPERDEALGTIALRYFRGRGPITRQDFAGWTGLTAADAKRGIAVGPATRWPGLPSTAWRPTSTPRSSTPPLPRPATTSCSCCPGSTNTCWATKTAHSWSPTSTRRPSSPATTGSSSPPWYAPAGSWPSGNAPSRKAGYGSPCNHSHHSTEATGQRLSGRSSGTRSSWNAPQRCAGRDPAAELRGVRLGKGRD